jgi:glycosyltransferase involved in cell wall biosynthesis
MKILQIVQKPQRRGAEVFAFQLSQGLRLLDQEVRIVYLYAHQGANSLPLQKEDYLLVGQENHLFEKFPTFHPRLLYQLRQLLVEFRPDVVQVNGGRAVKYGAFARHVNQNGSWVLIYRSIGYTQDWVRGWQRRFLYQKVVMPQIDGVIGVSQTTLQNLKDFYGVSVPMTHIPNGVATETLKPAMSREATRRRTHTPSDAPLLIYVGSLTFEKRIDRLLRVVGQVVEQIPTLHMWLIGDGPLRPKLEQQTEALGMTDIVHFLGVQADVATYMNAADLFLLTSDTEGIPAVVLEASWLRLPVVATRVGGIPECVLDGETGLLASPEDEAGLAQAISNLLQHPQQRAVMGARGHEWIRMKFTIDIVARQYLNFYREVLAI